MDRKNRDEITYRRRAIRLTMKGKRPCEILSRIPRCREWLRKWRLRYEHQGWAGLASGSHRPHHSPHEYSREARAVVVNLRRKLTRSCVGCVGARAVRQEILRCHLLREVPSAATIKRWLKEAGLIKRVAPPPEKVYYPQPRVTPDRVLHVMDWIARYIEGGEKIFAFHTLDWQTRALTQTLKANKTVVSVTAHVLETWQKLGLPDFLQLDNDAAFTGGSKTPRRFGAFVRLALAVGIELIFTPPAEPQRNGLVESLNGLWAAKFWERNHFRALREVERKSTQFTDWYAHRYYPPALEGLTPARALKRVKRQRLTQAQVRALPPRLPLTAGRLHFIRRVSPQGEISLLGETWRVSTRLAGQYVWATVITHVQRLEIYHRRSERAAARLVKVYEYAIAEPVQRLQPQYRRFRVRQSVPKLL
jgi:Integrase core domain